MKKQTKQVAICLLISLIIGIVVGAVVIGSYLLKQYFYEPKSYNEFLLEGKQVTLPISVDDFKKLGFIFEEDLSTSVVEAKSFETVGFTNKKFKDTGFLGYAYIYNAGEEMISEDEGIIIGLQITYMPQVGFMQIDYPQIKLLNGITFDSTKQEIEEAYGQADVADYAYIWYQENYEQNYFDLLSIEYSDEQMLFVTIQYMGELKEK